LEQGPLEETLIRRARAERKPVPSKIAGAPRLLPGLGFYFNAFLALSSCRPIGMGEGRIPWHSAYQYAQALELDSEEFEDLWVLVSFMDAAYLKFRAAQADAGRKKPTMD
jgi:hypothetical protein